MFFLNRSLEMIFALFWHAPSLIDLLNDLLCYVPSLIEYLESLGNILVQ